MHDTTSETIGKELKLKRTLATMLLSTLTEIFLETQESWNDTEKIGMAFA